MGNIIIFEDSKKLNLKHLFIFMDEIINKSLNGGNIYFFITINFKENIKKNSEIKKKNKRIGNIN